MFQKDRSKVSWHFCEWLTSQNSGINPQWTHVVAVEGVEDPRDVAAQDADGDPGVVQRHPAAAGLLRAVAAEQVIPHRAQHAQLRREDGKIQRRDGEVRTG